MKEIALTKGRVALVDDADFDWLNQWKWHSSSRYAARRDPAQGRKTVLMHRLILGLPDAVHGDHANGDGLDNQRENLRPATVRQNMANRRRQKGAKNPYCGVERLPSGRFRAKWKDGERYVHGGVFSTPEEAAAVRDAAVRRIHGEYAWTNFPTK